MRVTGMIGMIGLGLLALLLVGVPAPARAINFYVAQNGRDSWSGRLKAPNRSKTDGPFATLERARDAIRTMRPRLKSGVTVSIRGGVYERTVSFKLGPEDAGSAAAPIVYRAYPGETARINGGRAVTAFTPVTDPAILARLDPVAHGHVLQTDLKAQGIQDFGAITSRGFGRPMRPAGLELFFEDRPMTLARWPNTGWTTIAAASGNDKDTRFGYSGDRPSHWVNDDDVWVHGFWKFDWADTYEKIKSIDTANHEITTDEPGVFGFTKGQRYYVLNALEELDEPGEWYLDRKSGILYFWPPAPLAGRPVYASILSDPLVTLTNTSFVTLQGLTFEDSRGTGVEMHGGSHNRLADCMVRNVGDVGVDLQGGTDSGVSHCEITHTGEGGVNLSGGDRMTLTPGHDFVDDSNIHDFSRWALTYRPAVGIDGVGNRVSHNWLHDAPHTAVLLHGNDHEVAFNEIDHVCMEVNDAGAFYMGRDFTERGNVIRDNYFHDLGKGDVQAVYLDDCASGSTVIDNIMVRAGRGVMIGGGRDNVVENNLFIQCRPAIHIDARGEGWANSWFNGKDPTLMDRLKAVHYNQPPYSVHYPRLANILQDDPAVPKGNVVTHNVNTGGPWMELLDGLKETDPFLTIRDNWTTGDPGFVDLAHGFQLKKEAPVFKLGFHPIPFDQIGPSPHPSRDLSH